jgi:hypothetical protein
VRTSNADDLRLEFFLADVILDPKEVVVIALFTHLVSSLTEGLETLNPTLELVLTVDLHKDLFLSVLILH